MSKTKNGLDEAVFYYHNFMRSRPPTHDYFFYRDAFIASAGTLPRVMVKEFRHIDGFMKWYVGKRNYIKGYFRDFVNAKTVVESKSSRTTPLRYKGKLIASGLSLDKIQPAYLRELVKDYFKYLRETVEEWQDILSGRCEVKTCLFCKAAFEEYKIINEDRFCPECGCLKEATEKRVLSSINSSNSEPPQKPWHDKFQQPTAGSNLFESAIRRKLLIDSIQHPITLLFLTIVSISIVYLAILSPVMGKSLWGIIPLIVSGIAAVVSLILRYVFLRNTEYPKRVIAMTEEREKEHIIQEAARTKRRRDALHAEFSILNYAEGLKAIATLSKEYDLLQVILMSEGETDSHIVSRFSGLIADTYKQGLSALSDALEMRMTIHTSDILLKKELANLEEEIEVLKRDAEQPERFKIKKETLASHKQRIALLDQVQLRVEQSFYHARLCEASLNQTRIELSALRAQSTEESVNKLTETLLGTIEDVKEAQKELRRLEK